MRLLLDIYRFVRFSAFGATAVLPLLGAGSVRPSLPKAQIARLMGVSAAFHVFAYVHNDVCDLELDRSQPLRAEYPLVRGDLSPHAALAIALGCIPLAFAADAAQAQPVGIKRRRGLLGGAFALMAAYNLWGKRLRFPPATDALQGLSWALLLQYGAAASGERASRLTWLLSAYELALILMVNGVHGALRDLANDQAQGANTTALMFGARASHDGSLQITPGFAIYAAALQVVVLALPIWAATQNIAAQPQHVRRRAVAGVGLTAGLILCLLAGARRLRPVDIGILHLLLLLSLPVALVAPQLDPALRYALLAAHSISPLANGLTFDALKRIAAGFSRPGG